MKFVFIHAEKAFFRVSTLCRLLEVTRQGYYAFARRPAAGQSPEFTAGCKEGEA
jgi:putative transposase